MPRLRTTRGGAQPLADLFRPPAASPKNVKEVPVMYMPGYTAEASLYRTSSAYRATYQPGFGGRAGLIPQGPVVCTECFWDTYDYNVPTCAKLCRRTAPPDSPNRWSTRCRVRKARAHHRPRTAVLRAAFSADHAGYGSLAQRKPMLASRQRAGTVEELIPSEPTHPESPKSLPRSVSQCFSWRMEKGWG
jgi:hypothetical protein